MTELTNPLGFAVNTLREIALMVEDIEMGEVTPDDGLDMIRTLAKTCVTAINQDRKATA